MVCAVILASFLLYCTPPVCLALISSQDASVRCQQGGEWGINLLCSRSVVQGSRMVHDASLYPVMN